MTAEVNNVAITSLKQVAALLKKAPLESGTVNLDLGGGRYDEGTIYLAEKGVTSLVLDPFNRDDAHNLTVVQALHDRGGADSVTLANVLNVIESPQRRHNTLMKASMHMRRGARIYISVYEGNGSGEGAVTKTGSYQANRRMADYLEEIRQVFPDAGIRKGMIVGTFAGWR